SKTRDSDPMIAHSAFRRLERIYIAGAHYLADAQWQSGDLERVRLGLSLGIAAFPARAHPYCRLAQLEGREAHMDRAFAALADCLDRNYRDVANLTQDPDWEPLRRDPRWQSTVSRLQ
ncbi:MAG: hypothetical protein LH650_11335, partial [Chloroflexi bacterium]|nr:hypothetical protein [Chloroflexota bacterium]